MFMSEWWWVSVTGHRMVWSCSSSCLSRASIRAGPQLPVVPDPGRRRRTTATPPALNGGPFRRACAQSAPVHVSEEISIRLSGEIYPGDPEKGERSQPFRVLVRTPFIRRLALRET